MGLPYDYRTNVESYPRWQAGCARSSLAFWFAGADVIRHSSSSITRLESGEGVDDMAHWMKTQPQRAGLVGMRPR